MSTTHLENKPTCKNCNNVLDGAFRPGEHIPSPGDFTVCLYCGNVGRYDPQMNIGPCTEQEVEEQNMLYPGFKDELYKTKELCKLMLDAKQRKEN